MYVVALVLCAMTISAADYLDSFSEYRLQVRRNLGVTATNTSYVSDTTLKIYPSHHILTSAITFAICSRLSYSKTGKSVLCRTV